MNHDYKLEERVVGNSVYVHSFNANFIEAISSTNLESDLDSWYNAISTHLRNRVNQITTAVKPSATDRKVVKYFQNDEYATILDTVKSKGSLQQFCIYRRKIINIWNLVRCLFTEPCILLSYIESALQQH